MTGINKLQIKNTETKKNIIKNYAFFLIGLAIAALGVALSTKAGLGTTPVAAVPYSVSILLTSLSFGTWLNILSLSQITAEVIILKGKCNPIEIVIQTALAFAYGYMTDFGVYLIRNLNPVTYIQQLLVLALSCFVLALGIWIQFKGGVAMLPGEALNRAIAKVTKFKYSNVKIVTDVCMILIAAAICLIFIGSLVGVREGSIIAAICVGLIIKLYNKIFDRIIKAFHKTRT